MEMTCIICGHAADVCLARQNADDSIRVTHAQASASLNAMLLLGGQWIPNAFGMRTPPPRQVEVQWVAQ